MIFDGFLRTHRQTKTVVYFSGSGNEIAPFTGTVVARVWSQGGAGAADEGVSGGASGFSEITKAVTVGDSIAWAVGTPSTITFPDLTALVANAATADVGGTASGGDTNTTGANGVADSSGATAPNGVVEGPFKWGGTGGTKGSKESVGNTGNVPGGGGGSGGKDSSGSSVGGTGAVAFIFYV